MSEAPSQYLTRWIAEARSFLVKAKQVARRVAEGGNPWGIARGIVGRSRNDHTAMRRYLRESGVNIVDPDIGEQPGFAAVGDPSAADVAGGVIETWTSRVAMTNVPAEYTFVERNRLLSMKRWNFQVTDARAA